MVELVALSVLGLIAWARHRAGQGGQAPVATQSDSAQPAPATFTPPTGQTNAYTAALANPDPQGIPSWSTTAGQLAAQLQQDQQAGHSVDVAVVQAQIANAQAQGELSPEAQAWLSDKLAQVAGFALSTVPVLGGLLKDSWSAAYANAGTAAGTIGTSQHAVAGSAQAQQEAELAPTDKTPVGTDPAFVSAVRALATAYNASSPDRQGAILRLVRASLQYHSPDAILATLSTIDAYGTGFSQSWANTYASNLYQRDHHTLSPAGADMVRQVFAGLL